MPCKHCGYHKVIKGHRICYSCRYSLYKAKHPHRLAYTQLRGHAKERGKVFDLTFEDFKTFCIESDYINCKGIEKHSYHIDRIDETKGYTIDNIQVLTNSKNIRKYISFVGFDENLNKVFKTNKALDLSCMNTETPF